MKKLPPLLLLLVLAAGCAKTPDSQPYLDDLARVLTVHDTLSASYCEALEAARAYGLSPTKEGLAEAKAACAGALQTAAGLETVDSALTAEQLEAMASFGVSETDYMTPFRTQEYERLVRMQTLGDVLACLNRAPAADEAVLLLSELELEFEQWDRELRYLGINELLCTLPAEETAAFREETLASLASYADGLPPWEDTREAAAKRSEETLAAMEDWAAEAAQESGELYASLLGEARDLVAELEVAGIPADEASAIRETYEALDGAS